MASEAIRKICGRELQALDKRFRTNLVNSLSGFKSANLISTYNPTLKIANCALFSSVVHIGANPALIGFIQRPTINVSKDNEFVERNTYENIMMHPYFTISHIHSQFIEKAHLTSNKFAKNVSEFDECGLNYQYIDPFSKATDVPFVKESKIQIGLKFEEEYLIKANNTRLMIGSVELIVVPNDIIKDNGYLDLESVDDVCISGLDTYHSTSKLETFEYSTK